MIANSNSFLAGLKAMQGLKDNFVTAGNGGAIQRPEVRWGTGSPEVIGTDYDGSINLTVMIEHPYVCMRSGVDAAAYVIALCRESPYETMPPLNVYAGQADWEMIEPIEILVPVASVGEMSDIVWIYGLRRNVSYQNTVSISIPYINLPFSGEEGKLPWNWAQIIGASVILGNNDPDYTREVVFRIPYHVG